MVIIEMSQPEIYIHPFIGIFRSIIAVIDDLDLRLSHPEDVKTHIHRIRVDIKRLRAWVRLVRDKSDKRYWQALDHNLRDIAKQFSAGRDQQIIPETLKWLEKNIVNPEKQSAVRKIRGHLQSAIDGCTLAPKTIDMPYKDLLKELRRKCLSHHSDDLFRKGFRRTYNRAARLGKKACSGRARPDDHHKFRKWVKYLCYQIEFIRILLPERHESTHRHLDKLDKQLGRINDLVVVRRKLEQLSSTDELIDFAEIAGRVADKKIKKQLGIAKNIYRKVFSKSRAKLALDLSQTSLRPLN